MGGEPRLRRAPPRGPRRGWVVALADMPWVRPATIARVAAARRRGAPMSPRRFTAGGAAIRSDSAAALLRRCSQRSTATRARGDVVAALRRRACVRIDVDDPGVLRDVDRRGGPRDPVAVPRGSPRCRWRRRVSRVPVGHMSAGGRCCSASWSAAPTSAQLRLLQRLRDQVALRFLAALALQELELRRGLDALGDHAQAERVRQRDDRLRDRLVVPVLLEAVDEALVDLDALDRQPREVGQARIAGAEVVDGDRHAALLQLDQRRHRLLRVRDDHALGDLEIEVLRRQAADAVSASSTIDSQLSCCSCCTERLTDSRSSMPWRCHCMHLAAGVAQHARAERLDHPRFLGDRDELGGQIDAALGIAPAQQRLDAAARGRVRMSICGW